MNRLYLSINTWDPKQISRTFGAPEAGADRWWFGYVRFFWNDAAGNRWYDKIIWVDSPNMILTSELPAVSGAHFVAAPGVLSWKGALSPDEVDVGSVALKALGFSMNMRKGFPPMLRNGPASGDIVLYKPPGSR